MKLPKDLHTGRTKREVRHCKCTRCRGRLLRHHARLLLAAEAERRESMNLGAR